MRIYSERFVSSFVLAVAILLVGGCGSSRRLGEQDRIVLASGGGFTGAWSGYMIKGNGDVLGWRGVNATPDSLRPLFKLSADSTDLYFSQLDEMSFATIEFNSPGNLTYYVEQKQGDSSHMVRWGDARYTPPAPVADFYARAIEMILNRTQRR
jgi:hypothetical protein